MGSAYLAEISLELGVFLLCTCFDFVEIFIVGTKWAILGKQYHSIFPLGQSITARDLVYLPACRACRIINTVIYIHILKGKISSRGSLA